MKQSAFRIDSILNALSSYSLRILQKSVTFAKTSCSIFTLIR